MRQISARQKLGFQRQVLDAEQLVVARRAARFLARKEELQERLAAEMASLQESAHLIYECIGKLCEPSKESALVIGREQ